MSRIGHVYTLVPGSYGIPDQPVLSGPYNTQIDDFAADLNTPRPPEAGGTGEDNAEDALAALGGIAIADLDAMFCGSVDYFPFTVFPEDGGEGGETWLVCNGQAVSRTTYSLLFSRMGTTFGDGNGSSTFNVPDLRGKFVRGLDMGAGIDDGRALGSSQDDDVKAHTHAATAAAAGAHTHTYERPNLVGGLLISSAGDGDGYDINDVITATSVAAPDVHDHEVTVDPSTGTESRPKNIAFVAMIYARGSV